MGDTDVLVAQRYDRRIDDGGRIVRLHQEDMCQAAGLRPKDKYRPRERIAALFRQIVFRAVVGDEDGHGKNYSLSLDDGTVYLAPLYESLSNSLSAAIGDLDDQFTQGWSSEQVTDIVLVRIARLEDGQPFGGAPNAR